MTASVRLARVSDAAAVAALTLQLGYEVSETVVAERLSRIVDRSDHRFWVAEIEEGPVGWLHAMISQLVETDPFVAIAGLVVDRHHRGRGTARLLMTHAERWALAEGCSIVRLRSSVARTGAHRFYERLGYTNIKTQYSFARNIDPNRHVGFGGFVPDIED